MNATKWEDVYRTQTARIAELEATLDAVTAANERATKRWQAAHPGKELVIPDQAKMVEWLLEELAKFDDPHRLHAHCVRHLTDLQVSHLFGERMTAVANDRDRLEAENAALRANNKRASERLRYLAQFWNPKNDFKTDEIGKWIVIGDYDQMIEAIDHMIKAINAARKEAQP